ncbi:MAG: hypothetical protein SFV54_07840 [Bryobacteraceae bacterium]|nr:hypothetical protein [Bryobacteraceae bacterium]
MKVGFMAAFAATALMAQTTDEVRGRKVVDEALAALGGEKFQAMRDRVEFGRVYSFDFAQRLSGLGRAHIYTRYLTKPNPPQPGFLGLRERTAYGKDQDWWVIFNEQKEGWEVTYRGAQPLSEEQLARWRDSQIRNVFYILHSRLDEPGMIIESRGADVIDNIPVETVDFTDAENRVTRVYFQRSTKLPVKQYFERRDKTGLRSEEVLLFSKFRDIGGGVQWPFVIRRERDGRKVFEVYSEKVDLNPGLTDDLFTLPASMKLLPPKK